MSSLAQAKTGWASHEYGGPNNEILGSEPNSLTGKELLHAPRSGGILCLSEPDVKGYITVG